jgi:hypothetical protein
MVSFGALSLRCHFLAARCPDNLPTEHTKYTKRKGNTERVSHWKGWKTKAVSRLRLPREKIAALNDFRVFCWRQDLWPRIGVPVPDCDLAGAS